MTHGDLKTCRMCQRRTGVAKLSSGVGEPVLPNSELAQSCVQTWQIQFDS